MAVKLRPKLRNTNNFNHLRYNSDKLNVKGGKFIMFEVILLIAGAAGGFCLYKMVITSDSRQSTINSRNDAFDSITESWTEVRHFILANHQGKLLSREATKAIDSIHKNSKQLIEKLKSTCENQLLIADINGFNESIYQN